MAKRPWLARLGAVGGRTSAIIVALVLAVLALERVDLRLDLSADGRFTMQPGLANILAKLDEPVQATAIWRRDQLTETGLILVDSVERQLRELGRHSDKLAVRILDARLDLPAIEAFAADHGEAATGTIYLTAGDRRPFRIQLSSPLRHTLQRSIGGGISALTSATRQSIYILQGHGELGPGDSDDSMALLIERLRFAAFDPVGVDQAGLARFGGRIPSDGLLIVPGPTAPLGTEACAAVDNFLQAGGRALLLIDDRCPADLLAVLERYGVVRSPAGVVQAQEGVTFRDDRAWHRLVLATGAGILEAPISERVRADNGRLISPRTARIRYLAGLEEQDRTAFAARGITPPRIAVDLLAVPLGPTWEAPADQLTPVTVPEADQGRPAILATALAYDPIAATDGPRLTIWGSRDGAADSWLADGAYRNETFLLDCLTALADRQRAVPIDPMPFTAWQVTAEDGTLSTLVALLVAILPSCCVGMAILVWWERR